MASMKVDNCSIPPMHAIRAEMRPGRFLDHASGELVGPELGHSQQCAVSHLAHPFTAAGKHARARYLRHLGLTLEIQTAPGLGSMKLVFIYFAAQGRNLACRV